VRPLELSRCTVPAGAMAWACVYLAHRNPDAWDEPAAFRPERFLGDTKIQPNQFMPFGGGRRRCIGMAFASLELVVVAAEILRRAELRLAPGGNPAASIRGITISPADGLGVVSEPVRAARAPHAADATRPSAA